MNNNMKINSIIFFESDFENVCIDSI